MSAPDAVMAASLRDTIVFNSRVLSDGFKKLDEIGYVVDKTLWMSETREWQITATKITMKVNDTPYKYPAAPPPTPEIKARVSIAELSPLMLDKAVAIKDNSLFRKHPIVQYNKNKEEGRKHIEGIGYTFDHYKWIERSKIWQIHGYKMVPKANTPLPNAKKFNFDDVMSMDEGKRK